MTNVNGFPPAQYGRCGSCEEIKHVAPDGVLHGHNRYQMRGTALVTVRCPGSGTHPVDREAA